MEDMLQLTQPQLDWQHFDRGGRMRALRKKARENLKQQQAVGGAARASSCSSANGTSQDDDNAEVRVKAVVDLAESALNAAMADGNAGAELTEQERKAKATMARFESTNNAETSPP